MSDRDLNVELMTPEEFEGAVKTVRVEANMLGTLLRARATKIQKLEERIRHLENKLEDQKAKTWMWRNRCTSVE